MTVALDQWRWGYRFESAVYFVGPEDRSIIKIGFTCNPPNRLSGLMCWSPVPLQLLAVAPGDVRDKQRLHWLFLEHFSHKEWFRAPPALLALIAEVERTETLPAATGQIVVPPHFRLPDQRKRGGSACAARGWITRRAREAARASGVAA